MSIQKKRTLLDGISRILSEECGMPYDEAKRLFLEDVAPYVPGQVMEIAKGALGLLAIKEAGISC